MHKNLRWSWRILRNHVGRKTDAIVYTYGYQYYRNVILCNDCVRQDGLNEVGCNMTCDPGLGKIIALGVIILFFIIIDLLFCLGILILHKKIINRYFEKTQDLLRNTPK